MAEFFDDVKRIRDTIQRIEAVVGDVETRHEELLLAYNKDQTEKANRALEQAMSNITTYSNNVRNRLKKMDGQVSATRVGGGVGGSPLLCTMHPLRIVRTRWRVEVDTTCSLGTNCWFCV